MSKQGYNDKDQYGHPRIPFRGHYDRTRCDRRREWAEEFSSSTLKHTGEWWVGEGIDDSSSCLRLKGNIENPIGLAKVPVGIVGPLLLRGEHVTGYALCPFATTEGALVASATRGATALTRAGGVRVMISKQCMTRAPAFQLRSMAELEILWKWFSSNLDALQKQVKLFSQHSKLVELEPVRLGRLLVVQFKYETQDAAGQNMVTSGTWHACKWALRRVENELPSVNIVNFWIESDITADKKIAAMHLFQTRGIHAQAEAWIPEAVLNSVLKIDTKTLLECYSVFQHCGIHTGGIGCNINVSNVLAAVFIATGQDVGCIADSASAQLIITPATEEEIQSQGKHSAAAKATEKLIQLELNQTVTGSEVKHPYGGIYACLILPSLVVGTVGGGTALATQKECLNLMGCHGQGGVGRFAEMIVGFALGLDLSTLAAVASGQFATAHEKLGRNHPTHGLREEGLSRELFAKIVGSRGEVTDWTPFNVMTGNSILSELTKAELSKKVGHFGFRVNYKGTDGTLQTLPVVLKSKPTDIETSNMINMMAQGCGFALAVHYERHKMEIGFRHCHTREVLLAQLDNPQLKMFMPDIYHTIFQPSKDVYIIAMELLTPEHYTLLDTADDISGWTESDIKVVLRDLARVHSLFLPRNQQEWMSSQPWLEAFTGEKMGSMASVWRALLKHAKAEFPEFWTDDRVTIMENAIDNIPQMWSVLESAPYTLVHNDCNPRNICLRKPDTPMIQKFSPTNPAKQEGSTFTPYSSDFTMCMYDWELATIGVPQHDLAEFLAFSIQPNASLQTRLEFIDFYRQHLQHYSGMEFPNERFVEVFNMACLDFAMNRLLMYTMAHTYKDYQFLPRVVNSHFTYLQQQVVKGAFSNTFKSTKSKL